MPVWKQILLICALAALAYGGHRAWTVYGPAPGVDATSQGQGRSRAAPVELARATPRTIARTVEAVGTTRARQSVEIVPEADGRVIEITITPGRQVDRGEVLVRLDDTIERANLAEAEARVTEQSQALDRVRQLRETNAVSQATLEDTIARVAEARADLDRARRRLEDRVITAPFAGVVGLAEIDTGARVDTGDMITRLDDLSEVIVEFALPETLFADVRKGLRVTAASAAYPGRAFEGRIVAVDSRIDPVSRAFRTRAAIPNPDRALPAGMFMSLTLTLSESQELTVPEEAVVFEAAQTYVFTVADGTARRQPVETGQRRDGFVAIEGGIAAGTPVIVRGLQRVRDGKPVTILDDKDGDGNGQETAEGDT